MWFALTLKLMSRIREDVPDPRMGGKVAEETFLRMLGLGGRLSMAIDGPRSDLLRKWTSLI